MFELPKLTTLVIKQFGTVRDVGRVCAPRQSMFNIRSIELVETFFSGSDSHSVQESLHLLLGAFKKLESLHWGLANRFHNKLRAVASIVDGLSPHTDTIKNLVLVQDHHDTVPARLQTPWNLPPEMEDQTNTTDFDHFTKLETLTVFGRVLCESGYSLQTHQFVKSLDQVFATTIHKLPLSLQRLTIYPLDMEAEPALHLASLLAHCKPADYALEIKCLFPPIMALGMHASSPYMQALLVSYADEHVLEPRHGQLPRTDDMPLIEADCQGLLDSYTDMLRQASNGL